MTRRTTERLRPINWIFHSLILCLWQLLWLSTGLLQLSVRRKTQQWKLCLGQTDVPSEIIRLIGAMTGSVILHHKLRELFPIRHQSHKKLTYLENESNFPQFNEQLIANIQQQIRSSPAKSSPSFGNMINSVYSTDWIVSRERVVYYNNWNHRSSSEWKLENWGSLCDWVWKWSDSKFIICLSISS